MKSQYKSIRHQVGTLGGGNHFIELQHDEDGWIWIMIHSGSRNLDEAASAYKDIDQVIALETDLVKVKTKLEPIAVIKG